MTHHNAAVAKTDEPRLNRWAPDKCPTDQHGRPIPCYEHPDHPGVLAVCPENAEAIAVRPMLLLPAPVRRALAPVWAMNEEVYKTPGPLAMILAVFMQLHGLREDDAVDILKDMTKPAELAEMCRASDVKTRLAVGANERIKRRRSEDQAARLRLEAKQADRTGNIIISDIFKEVGSA